MPRNTRRVTEFNTQPKPEIMKIAIINTMSAHDNHAGTVISTHRSRAAAERADAALQRAIKKHNGQNSYLPTVIAEVEAKAKKGMRIHDSLIIS